MAARAKASSTSGGAWLLLAGIAVLTVFALGGVMRLRFGSGESYPEYSTRRVDPLGTRALYEALGRLKGVTVEQNFRSLDNLSGDSRSTLILTGLDTRQFHAVDVVDAEAVARFAADGGRVVLALNPEVGYTMPERAYRDAREEKVKEAGDKAEPDKPKPPVKKEVKEAKPKPDAQDKAKKEKDAGELRGKMDWHQSFAQTLKIDPRAVEFFYGGGKSGSPLTPASALPLKAEQLPLWMSNLHLDTRGSQDLPDDGKDASQKPGDGAPEAVSESTPWTTLATKGDRIMIAERKLGAGTVVVCTDRYFLSNEALWKTPKPAFLAWLIGDAKRVVFDETHLAEMIGDADGVMTLARRYGMHGLFLGCLLLFILFIWRSAISLVPSNPADDLGLWRAQAVAGQGSASGLEGLLRRGFPTKGLLHRCFEVWQSTRASSGAVAAERRARAQVILHDPAAMKHPVSAYQAIRDALHHRR
jgi:hypothetical protein